MNQSARLEQIKPVRPQFSVNRERTKISNSEQNKKIVTAKKVHRHQKEIRADRSQERNFRENQKENGAKNYEKIWIDR